MYVEDLVLMTRNEGNLDEVEEHTIVRSYCVQLRMGLLVFLCSKLIHAWRWKKIKRWLREWCLLYITYETQWLGANITDSN